MAVKFQDYYKTLGVERDVSGEAIQRAYRKLAREYHPDMNKAPQAEAKFKQIGEAYEVLKDPDKRSRYDQLGENWKAGQEFRPPPGYENFNFQSGGQGGFDFQGGGQFSDFFESLFTSGHSAQGSPFTQQAPRNPRQPPEQEAEISITLAEAHQGTTRSLTLQGAGGKKSVEVKIPAGTKSGQKIRLRGEKLLLKINIAPDPHFTLIAHDLTTDVSITPATAALGGKVEVETLDGPVTLTIPPATSSGRLRLKGKGLGHKGDLFAKVKIVVPKTLTDEQQRLYEELQQHDQPDQ